MTFLIPTSLRRTLRASTRWSWKQVIKNRLSTSAIPKAATTNLIPTTKSLFQEFRSQKGNRGRFNVTDLSDPAWCEYKFEYSLRQGASKPLEQQPKTFVSGKGKEINVDQKLAVSRENILRGGQTVHKDLERELDVSETVTVVLESKEELWANGLLDSMIRFTTLEQGDICRELRVWGMVNGFPVSGIIDEVHKKPLEDSKTDSDATTYALHIVDNKTRQSPRIPSLSSALSGRIQCMLYHRLLSALISTESPFDFYSYWSLLGLDPKRRFSSEFKGILMEVGVCDGLELVEDATCLEELIGPFQLAVQGLNVDGKVHNSLQLVYRSRGDFSTEAVWPPRDPEVVSEQDLLKQMVYGSKTAQGWLETPSILRGPLNQASDLSLENFDAHLSLLEEEMKEFDQCAKQLEEDLMRQSRRDKGWGKIIGNHEFAYDPVLLDKHLSKTMDWWLGRRGPVGVDIEDAWKCYSCPYQDDCEWREVQAEQISKSPRPQL